MDYTGMPHRQETLSWSAIPTDVACLHPYILTLMPNKIDVHNLSTLKVAESIAVAGCRAMHLTTFPIGGGALGALDGTGTTHRPRKRLSTMLVSSGTTIHSFHMVPLPVRLDQLLSSRQYDDALVLCALSRGKDEEMDRAEHVAKEHTIHLSYAHHLYTTRQFTQSRHEYLLSDCDPRVVLALFPPLLPEGVPPS